MGYLDILLNNKNHFNLLLFIPKLINFLIIRGNSINIFTKNYFVRDIIKFLKYSSFFNLKILNDLTAVDFIDEKKRFKIIYNFSSIYHNQNYFIHFSIPTFFKLDSIIDEYKSANWLEREI
jgi:NADH:ubiquinone oxidoreductase subunit C